MRTEPSAAEQSRAQPNKQRLLPIECVEQSDAAYLACLRECGLPYGTSRVVEWLILDGRRDAGGKRLPKRTQRQLATRLNLSASTVCESLRRLQASGLVTEADGDWRLDLQLLVQIAEEAAIRRAAALERPDPAAALDTLCARPRSACSAALGGARYGSVEKRSLSPVSVSESVSVSGGTGGDEPSAERGERGRPLRTARDAAAADNVLKSHPAWRRLQTRHLRPALDLPALRPCFAAAKDAGLFGDCSEPADLREAKFRFLATAWDLAKLADARSPAVCLRIRVERKACYRFSDEAARWAAAQLREPEYAAAARSPRVEYVGGQV